MDYNWIIKWLRRVVEHGDEDPQEYCTNRCGGCEVCDQAADAIETLLAERDAAVEDLVMAGDCKTCGNVTTWCMENPDCCKGYKWRGPQKGDGHGD